MAERRSRRGARPLPPELLGLKQLMPELFDRSVRDLRVERDRIERIERQLVDGLPLPVAHQRLRALARLLERAVARRKWIVAYIPAVHVVRREPSRLASLALWNDCDARFIDVLRANLGAHADPLAAQGQILLSAILHGALIDKSCWAPLLAALCNEQAQGRCGKTGRLYLKLDLPEKHDRGDGRPDLYRFWFADQVTDILICRARRAGQLEEPFGAREALKAFIGLGNGTADFQARLRTEAITRVRLRMLPLLAAYAEGKLFALCPRDGVMARLLTDRELAGDVDLNIDLEAGLDVIEPAQPGAPKAPQALKKQYNALRLAFESSSAREAEVRQQIEAAIGRLGDGASPIIRQLADFAVDLLTRRQDRSVGRKPIYRVSSVSSYLSAIGPSLVALVADVDISTWPADEISDLYEMVVASGESASDKNRRATALMHFHDQLSRRHPNALPPVWVSGFGSAISVDASLLTAGDYERAMEILGRGRDKTLAKMHQLILALAYRGTLRRSEAWKMRLCEIVGEGLEAELHVRNNTYRRVKYAASKRLLPIGRLLSEPERDLFERFRQWRTESVGVSRVRDDEDALLFAEPGQDFRPIAAERLFGPIQQALRLATCDPQVTYHHARHSAANRLLAGFLLEPGTPGLDELPGLGLDAAFAAQVEHVRAWGLPRDGGGRASAELVSSLMGHADIATTLRSYVHIMPWLVAMKADETLAHDLDEAALASIAPAHRRDGAPNQRRPPLAKSLAQWRAVEGQQPGFMVLARSGAGRPRKPVIAVRNKEEQRNRLPDWRTLHMLLTSPQTPEALAAIVRLPADDIRHLRDSLRQLLDYRNRKDATVHRISSTDLMAEEFDLSVPIKRADRIILDNIWKVVGTYETLMGDSHTNLLRIFYQQRKSGANEITAGSSEEEARAFLQYLSVIGIRKEQVRLVHYPPKDSSQAEIRAQQREWLKALKLPGDACKRRGEHSFGSNRVSFRVSATADPAAQASYGVRFALLMLAVLRAAEERKRRQRTMGKKRRQKRRKGQSA